jgi:protein-L-isoaspartate(D-aspartate) O-methyltransferase
MTVEECRRFYADEVRFSANLRNAALVEAFARVPRETFLGPGPWEIGSAETRAMSIMGSLQMTYTAVNDPRDVYHNVVIALDKNTDTNNGQPATLARWIDAMDLKPGERAYHLGCGVGYYTAIMAEVVGPQGSVVGTEVQSELARRARQNLRDYANVAVHEADGIGFDPGECDAMLINAGVTHPQPLWLDSVADGGRLVLPLTMSATKTVGVGMMVRIVRHAGSYSAEMVSSVAIFSCTSGRDPQLEPALRQAMMGGFTGLKSLRRDPHAKSDTCLLHATDVCFSSVPTERSNASAG